MSKREQLLISIADTIQDYRAGEISKPTPKHVNRWVNQFDKQVQLPMLQEMDHVLKQTYFSQERVTEFLKGLIHTKTLVGDDPCKFWRNVKFLTIQKRGNSQTELLDLFNELLKDQCGFGIDQCGKDASTFLYLDDGIFTGNRTRDDIGTWVADEAPTKPKLHVIVIALHSGAEYYAGKNIKRAATAVGKEIDITWWREIELEARIAHNDEVDVLRPTHIPNDTTVQAYIAQMNRPLTLRKPGNMGGKALYTSDKGKILLEQEFLKAGVKIRQNSSNLIDKDRPLGNTPLVSLGFGALIVTYRNCPNNAPLALWTGDSWYPLFPRTSNSQAKFKRRMAQIKKGSKS